MSFALKRRDYKPPPKFISPIALGMLFTLGIGPNFMLVALACFVLIVSTHLLWRQGEPQILLFLFAYQWLQVTSTLFLANIRGVPVSELLLGFPAMGEAAFLVIVSLMILAIGMHFGAGPQRPFDLARTSGSIQNVPQIRWLQLHIVMWGVSIASRIMASMIPGLSQAFIALASFQWATFVIFTISTFSRPDASRVTWFVVFTLEFLSSFGGYFSSFKSVFVFTLLSLTAVGAHFTIAQVVRGAIVAVIMLTLGIYWTAIKPDYRNFVSGGQQAQIVTVSPAEAFGKIIELATEVGPEQLSSAAEQLAYRFSELDMFSAVVTYVPTYVPHEQGALWLDAIARVFMPRVLFPNKAIIDESELTRHFTGIDVAGLDMGTQISMGYIADSYIDFSEYGMWVPIFLFGYFLGYVYRWCVQNRNGNGLLGLGLACALLTQSVTISTSSAKLVGAVLVGFIVVVLFLNFVVPMYLRWHRV